MRIPWDLHVHTVYSGHSSFDMTVPAIVQAARGRGLSHLVILEHVPDVQDRDRQSLEAGHAPPQIEAIRAILDRIPAEARGGMRVYVGAEIDADPAIRDGRLLVDHLPGVEIVLASTHMMPTDPHLAFYDPRRTPQERLRARFDDWVAWACGLAANPQVHILAHPATDLVHMGVLEHFRDQALEGFAKVLAACAAHGTAFELNETLPRKCGTEHAKRYEDVIALARDLHVPLALGSDAHRLPDVGVFPCSSAIIERLGLDEEHFFVPSQ